VRFYDILMLTYQKLFNGSPNHCSICLRDEAPSRSICIPSICGHSLRHNVSHWSKMQPVMRQRLSRNVMQRSPSQNICSRGGQHLCIQHVHFVYSLYPRTGNFQPEILTYSLLTPNPERASAIYAPRPGQVTGPHVGFEFYVNPG